MTVDDEVESEENDYRDYFEYVEDYLPDIDLEEIDGVYDENGRMS